MDPFWYIWFACLLAVWFRTQVTGVSAWTRHGAERVGPQATFEDTVILANEMRVLEAEAKAAVKQAGWMNLVNNPDKFGLVHLSKDADGVMGPVRGSIQVGGERVKAKGCRTYVRLLGGDINWFSEATKDKVQLASKCKQLLGCMRFHVPGLVLMRVLVQGILINAWTHTKIVKMPVDSLTWIADKHQVASATVSVANVVRKVLRLPYKTPWRFIFGALHEGGLAVPHPARCLWVRFVAEMYSAMCSVHPLTKRVTQWEVQCGFQRCDAGGTLADDLGTDFDKLARWGTANGWSLLYRRGPDAGDRWECGADLSGAPHGLLILVGDASADAAQRVWGVGVAVADVHGVVLWQARAWMRAASASTTLFEITAVHEGTAAVLRQLQRQRLRMQISRWVDNQSAAIKLQHRRMESSHTDLLQRIEAHDELQWTDGILTGWAPAQHDTGCNDVVSMVNKVSDAEAEEVRLMQLSEEQWLCPACWCDGETMLFTWNGHVVCDVRRQCKQQYEWGAKARADSVEVLEPVARPDDAADGQLLKAWDRLSPYCPEDAAAILMSAFYEDLDAFVASEEVAGVCRKCGMQAHYLRAHLVHRCPVVTGNWEYEMAEIEAVLRRSVPPTVHTRRVWQGIQLRAGEETVEFLWVKPWRWALAAGDRVWHMYLGSVPSAAYVQHLQRLVNRDSRLLVLQCMRTLYRIQREGRDPKATRVHWVPMGMQREHAIPLWDPRDYAPQHSAMIRVPADVLHWAMMHTRYCRLDERWRIPHGGWSPDGAGGIPVQQAQVAADRVTWGGTVGSATQIEVLIRAWSERVRRGQPGVLLLLCRDGATNVEKGLARMVMQGVKRVRRKDWRLLCDAAGPVEYRMPRWEAWAAML